MNRRPAVFSQVRIPSLRAMLASVTCEVDPLPSRKPLGEEIIDWGEPVPCPTPRRCVPGRADLPASLQEEVSPHSKKRL